MDKIFIEQDPDLMNKITALLSKIYKIVTFISSSMERHNKQNLIKNKTASTLTLKNFKLIQLSRSLFHI